MHKMDELQQNLDFVSSAADAWSFTGKDYQILMLRCLVIHQNLFSLHENHRLAHSAGMSGRVTLTHSVFLRIARTSSRVQTFWHKARIFVYGKCSLRYHIWWKQLRLQLWISKSWRACMYRRWKLKRGQNTQLVLIWRPFTSVRKGGQEQICILEKEERLQNFNFAMLRHSSTSNKHGCYIWR